MTSIFSRFSYYLAKETFSYTKDPKLNSEIFAYALSVIFLNATAFGGILLFSWLLNTLNATLMVWLAFISLRIFAGSRHQTGPLGCWVLTVTVFTSLGFIVTYTAPIITRFALMLEATGFIFALYSVIAYAPVTIASKKFNQRKISKLKTTAIVVIIIWMSFVFNPNAIAAARDPMWSLAITAGLIAQSLSLLPVSFKSRQKSHSNTKL